MRLVFLGPPGAGKGTQAARVARHLGIPHIATGDIFRQAVEAGTPIGLRVKEVMDHGELVSDEMTNEVVRERMALDDTENGFVLDGYPRNVEQALAFEENLKELGVKLDKVIKFMVNGPAIVQRLSGRRICPLCKTVYHFVTHPPQYDEVCDNDGTRLVKREDDQPETVERRLEVYGKLTKPLYDFYDERGLLHQVDALGTTNQVFERLIGIIQDDH
ncbi:MAG TPA: adenylate kinase [Actinomycetota bacterium]|nr:adenylate kinase [Actinomycetota bacterium]